MSHAIPSEKFQFDSDGKTAIFDPLKEGNLAYILNTEILNGYIERLVADYIDHNHVWETGGSNPNWIQNAPVKNSTVKELLENGNSLETFIPTADYFTKCGVAVMSFDEYFAYLDKFGYQHNPNDNNRYSWLRSFIYQTNVSTYPYGPVVSDSGYLGRNNTFDSDANSIGRLFRGPMTSTMTVRPCFWLKPDFFKKVKIDVNIAGAEVKNIIRKNYTKEELAAIYTQAELELLGYTEGPPVNNEGYENFIPDCGMSFSKIEATGEHKLEVWNLPEKNDGKLTFMISSVEQPLVPIYVNEVEIRPNRRAELSLYLPESIEKGRYVARISTSQYPAPVSYYFVHKPNDRICAIEVPNAPFYVQDRDNASVNVVLSNISSTPQEYVLEYSVDGQEAKRVNIISNPAMGTKTRIRLEGLLNGEHLLNATLYDSNGNIVDSKSEKIYIIDMYTHKSSDEFSRYGMHLEASNGEYSEEDAKAFADLMRVVGIKTVRHGIKWQQLEMTKGVYDFDSRKYITYLYSNNIDTIAIMAFGNWHYSHARDRGYLPVTKENIDAYNNYIKAILLKYPKIKACELWNEPDLDDFWKGDHLAVEYATLVKSAALAIREINPNITINVCVSSSDGQSRVYMENVFKQQVYPYVDAVSFHPYRTRYTPDDTYISFTDEYDAVSDKAGGWLDKYVTEIGWKSKQYANELKKAEYIVKAYVYGDSKNYRFTSWFNFQDKDITRGYGLLDENYKPTLSFFTFSHMLNMLNDTQYVGWLEYENGAIVHVYNKNGQPLLVAWNKQGNCEFPFPGGAKVTDMYGNPTEERILTSFPVYVTNVGTEWFRMAADSVIAQKYSLFCEKYGHVNEGITVDNAFPKLSELGNSMIANSSSVDENLALRLYDLYRILEYVAAYKGAVYNGLYDLNPGSLELAQSYIAQKKSGEEKSTLVFSDKILRFANRHYNLAKRALELEDFEANQKFAAQNGMLYELTANWARLLAEKEEVNRDIGILSYTYPAYINAAAPSNVPIEYTVENRSSRNIDGSVAILDENGNRIAPSVNISLNAGETKEIQLAVPLGVDIGQSGAYTICLYEGERVINKKMLPYTVEDSGIPLYAHLNNIEFVQKENGKSASVTFSIHNRTESSQEFIAFVAAYKDGELLDVCIEPITVQPGTNSFELSSNVMDLKDDFGVKLIILDNLENIKPLLVI